MVRKKSSEAWGKKSKSENIDSTKCEIQENTIHEGKYPDAPGSDANLYTSANAIKPTEIFTNVKTENLQFSDVKPEKDKIGVGGSERLKKVQKHQSPFDFQTLPEKGM